MRKPEPTAERGAWALARFLRRKQLQGEKEKNALTGSQARPAVPKLRGPNAFRALGKAFFSSSPALGTHGAQKRAKAHIPGLLQDRARASFMVSGFPASNTGLTVAQAFQPPMPVSRWHRLSSLQCRSHGGTGFPASNADLTVAQAFQPVRARPDAPPTARGFRVAVSTPCFFHPPGDNARRVTRRMP